MSYEDKKIYSRYIALKYDKENGAIMPQHKKAELERYERMYKKQNATMRKKKVEM